MMYGFDQSGGFIVLDTERKQWLYAYPTSLHAIGATTKPAWTAKMMALRFDDEFRMLCYQGDEFRRAYLAQYDRLLGRIDAIIDSAA